MKRILPLLLLSLVAMAPAAMAQSDHIEIGAYGDFFRLNDANINFGGLGGRVGVNVNPWIQLEGEMTYDFAQTFAETVSNSGGTSGSVSVVNSDIRVLHGLFGPKFQTNRGGLRLFATAKGGFINFMFSNQSPGFNSFGNAVSNLNSNNVHAVFYPGLGAEAFLGPIGLRLDVGDEIYFWNGGRNNLRISFGPSIRF